MSSLVHLDIGCVASLLVLAMILSTPMVSLVSDQHKIIFSNEFFSNSLEISQETYSSTNLYLHKLLFFQN